MLALRPRLPVVVAVSVALVPAAVRALSGGPGGWHEVASVTGLAAAGLLAVSMVLVLRLPVLHRAFGGLGPLQWTHHALGVAGFLLLLVHPLALALEALPIRPELARALLWPTSSTVVLLGWVALGLFVVLMVVTVLPGLPFDLWRRSHQASGLAYAAMVGHLVAAWSGSLAAGLGLGLVGAGAVGFAWRWLAQDAPWRGLRYRVAGVNHRGPGVVDLVLEPHGRPLRFDAGQFANIAVLSSPSYAACRELHPYTMTGRPDDPRLRVSIKALGDCTRHVQEIVPGAEVLVQGPFGGLFPAGARRRPQLWIAGGMGVTPFLSRLESLGPDEPPIDLVYAATTPSGALYLPDLRARVQAHPSVRLHTMFEDAEGRPTAAAIQARAGPLADREVALAGPPAMVSALRRELRAIGVPPTRIHTELGVTVTTTRPVVFAAVVAFSIASATLAALAQSAPRPPPSPALRQLTAEEIARHDRPDDCWLLIRGKVYDVSRYIASHPTPPEVVTVHCGEESTRAFETKDVGRPHSAAAWQLLDQYLIGELRDP